MSASLKVSNNGFSLKIAERISLANEYIKTKIINSKQLEEFRNNYLRWNNYNTKYLETVFDNPDSEYKVKYDNCHLGGSSFPSSLAGRYEEIKRDFKVKILALQELEEISELIPTTINEVPNNQSLENQKMKNKANEKSKVFIVHGHDTLSKQVVARTLTQLDLEPVILHEQPNVGRTITEKFEHSSDVGFAVVILSGDDYGKAKNDIELKDRARQNVILELGYFIGKLGRDKVMSLYEDGVELPSDLYGLGYVSLDKNEKWKFELVKELKAAGYHVDANKII